MIAGNETTLPALISFLEREGIEVRSNPDVYVRSYKLFGIEEARDIRARASARALTGRRVFIITTPAITSEAQNALLKTFEEPSADAMFFLVVPSPYALLSTIRSRAQVLVLPYKEVSQSREKRSLPADATVFLSAAPEKRLALLAPLLEKGDDDKRDTSAILDFLDALERAVEAAGQREKDIEALYQARRYIADKGALVKPLLEQLAFLLPVVKSPA